MDPHNPDERRLSADELHQLKRFIVKRGFGEPAALLEVLDHFACKVEELWPQHPHWTLAEAMDAAHASFGTAGFYPIVQAFHKATERRFRRLFSTAFWRVPRTAVGLLLLLCAGWGYATLYRICASQGWVFFGDWNTATYLGYFILLCINVALFWERQPNPFLRSADRAVPPAVQVVAALLILGPSYEMPLPLGVAFFVLAAWYLRAKAVVRRMALREHQGLFRQVYGG